VPSAKNDDSSLSSPIMKNPSKEIQYNRETKRPKIETMEEPPLACLRTVRRKPATDPADSSGVDGASKDTEADAAMVAGREISAFNPRPRGRGGAALTSKNAESRLGSLSSCQLPADISGDDVSIANEKKEQTVDDLQSSIKPIASTKNLKNAPKQPNAKPASTKSPKQLLNEYYSKHHHLSSSQLKTMKSYYTSIKHSSLVKFACVLTCPVSGEHFSSGRMKDAEAMEDEEGVIWHCK
jgi:hypothetical protein